MLKIIAELSPCSEPTLLIVAANRGLERFGDGSLGHLSKLLGQCVQELQAHGVVEIDGEQLVIAPAGSAEDEDILDLTAELELRPSKLDEASSNQKQADLDYAWEEPRTGSLQTQPQVTGSTQRSPEPEEIIAIPAGSAEDEDILDLAAELELRPSKLNEASSNQKQADLDYAWEEPRTGSLQTQAQVTGSTKRAPEPTREEIIAAMRQFVSDDQTNQAQTQKANAQPQRDEEGLEAKGVADKRGHRRHRAGLQEPAHQGRGLCHVIGVQLR